ncbi:endo-1,4-beta-xylanase A precursor [Fomitiporia mediterranea MF3/22]|uniref:endo-1,4-beta-xylanase A precursor n=1 Tax=Fomitiporia mediterranea (strain MF3/22) TaxID=694068 RepID=UPI0004409758|nr:endo-1,4-beta-xylanase A precursor [Fomitiporia mediterranea MF3/22]EJD06385.1 endo-1,4-beta-xylanase A precursor [Fomitiporia mediterranea MF3/22]
MKFSTAFLSLLSLVPLAVAQQQVWGQCGGIGWTGPTTCVSGTSCVTSNPYYSQCIPSTNAPPPPPPSSSQPAGTPTSTASGGSATGGLDTIAKGAGKKYFGTATDASEFQSDAAYAAVLTTKGEFGQLTPLNSMKWDTTEPSRGSFNFAGGDALVAEAKANGQIVRGHNCVWYNQLPSWVSNSGFNSATLTSVIQTHCSTLVGHFKGEIYAWDVINEPFNDDGTWRSDVFYNTLGQSYVQIGLQAARGADSGAKLYINDYNIEYTGAKATAMINLVKSLKSAGVPLDGVGFQGHFIVGEVPTSLSSVMSQVAALGVEVAITELDIRMPLPASSANLAQQQRDYQSVIQQCNSVAGCIGVTVWDFSDKYSWVPNTFSGQGAACPWDQNMQKKAAYNGIVAGF